MSVDARTLSPVAEAGGAVGRLTRIIAAAAAPLLHALFVLSGAAGLIYESIWSRYLGLFLGHSAYAQVLVLAIFLGGMSGGAMAAGRRSERLQPAAALVRGRRDGRGLIGLIFHALFTATTDFALAVVFPALGGRAGAAPGRQVGDCRGADPAAVAAARRHLPADERRRRAPCPRAARAAPSRRSTSPTASAPPAACCSPASGSFRSFGLPGTVLTAALVNVAVGARCLPDRPRPARRCGPGAGGAGARPLRGRRSSRAAASPRLLLVVAFGTAVASFVYEITWIRMLSLVLGSATHSFELMLSAFILGLALGALCVRPLADREAMPLRMLGQVQWAMGAVRAADAAGLRRVVRLDRRPAADLRPHPGGLRRLQPGALRALPRGHAAGDVLRRHDAAAAHQEPARHRLGRARRRLGLQRQHARLDRRRRARRPGAAAAARAAARCWCSAPGSTWRSAVLVFAYAGREPRRAACDGALRLRRRQRGGRRWRSASTAFDQALLSSGVFRLGRLPQPGSRHMLFHRDGRTAQRRRVPQHRRPASSASPPTASPTPRSSPDWFGDPPPRRRCPWRRTAPRRCCSP